jgi:hypothetical protein
MRFDVYGRMQVVVSEDPSGFLRVEEIGGDGKRRVLHSIAVSNGASEDEIIDALEAACHEVGRPGESIRRLD